MGIRLTARQYLYWALTCGLAVCSVAAGPVAARGGSPAHLDAARQLILVVTPDWNDVQGELRRFDRKTTEEPWRAAGTARSIVVGRSGVAWDPALPPVVPGPVKAEGDGRSPAGVFLLGQAFGYAPAADVAWLRMPYLPVTSGVECVDDASSNFYNQIVDRSSVTPAPDWTSSEKMREVGEAYRWGVVVQYNAAPVVAKRGSCIFLHVGGAPGDEGTSGCTAMPTIDLRAVMQWLDPTARPVLVQLPRAAYAALQSDWRLP